MRDIVCFPGERSGTGNMNFAGAVEQVGFEGVVGRVEVVDAVHYEAVAVEIGSERIRGETPHALIIFLHRRWLGGAFDGDGDFLGIGSPEAEGDAIVGVDFRREDGRRLRLRVGMVRRNQFCEKQSCEQQREAFHQVHLEGEIRDNSGGGMLQHYFAAMHIRRMGTFLGRAWLQAGTDLPRCGDRIPFTACAPALQHPCPNRAIS